jgi:hypothetical protein
VIKIEANIPLPPKARSTGTAPKFPFAALAIGDSFLAPTTAKNAKARRRVLSCLMIYHAKKTGFRYASRKVDGGIRIWRIS